MDGLLGSILSLLLIYKYVTLFAVTFIAALFIPLPSSTLLVAAGAFAYQGYLNTAAVFSVALAGNILGDNAGYVLSRRYGREVLSRIGFRRVFDTRAFMYLEKYLSVHHRILIFISRFMTSVGPMVNIISGITGLSYRQYIVYEVLGETMYVLLYGGAGYILGSQWEYSITFITTTGITLASLGLVAFLIRWQFFHRYSEYE